MLDDLYGPDRPNDPKESSGPDDQNWMDEPRDMNGLGRPDKSDESVGPNDLKKSGELDDWNGTAGPDDPNKPGRPEDLNGPGGPNDPNGPCRPEYSDGLARRDTSFRKFNFNFFYKKLILDFELDPNIWTGFKSWSKYLNLDLKKNQTSFVEKMNLGRKSNTIIWIYYGCGLNH